MDTAVAGLIGAALSAVMVGAGTWRASKSDSDNRVQREIDSLWTENRLLRTEADTSRREVAAAESRIRGDMEARLQAAEAHCTAELVALEQRCTSEKAQLEVRIAALGGA